MYSWTYRCFVKVRTSLFSSGDVARPHLPHKLSQVQKSSHGFVGFRAQRLRGLIRDRWMLLGFRGPDHQPGDGVPGLGARFDFPCEVAAAISDESPQLGGWESPQEA